MVKLTQCCNDNYKVIDISINVNILSFQMVHVTLSIIIFFNKLYKQTVIIVNINTMLALISGISHGKCQELSEDKFLFSILNFKTVPLDVN